MTTTIADRSDAPTVAVRTDDTKLRTRIRAFHLSIDADDGKSPRTVATYTESVNQFADFLADKGLPTALKEIRREHIDTFAIYLRDDKLHRGKHLSDATRSIRLRSLRSFFQWAVDAKQISKSPMAGMKLKAPKRKRPHSLKEPELRKLVATAETGKSFENVRDAALLRMFMDTGCRRAELAGILFSAGHDRFVDGENDIDLDNRLFRVVGKGGGMRYLPLGKKAGRALVEYLLAREEHPYAFLPNCWLARKGALSAGGISQMVERRALAAGLGHVHVHQLRHSFINSALGHGMQEGQVMQLTGHRSRKMLDLYAADLAGDRAIEAHRINSPGDRI